MNRPHSNDSTQDDTTQKGQAIVLFAVFLGVFIGICSLVLDTGRLYSERRHAQNAADASALAAGALVTKMMMPCMSTPGCVDHVISAATESRVVQAATSGANANSSLLGGYAGPIDVRVEYQRYGTSTFVQMRPDSSAYLPGDTCKVRVTASMTWEAWIPLPTSDILRFERPTYRRAQAR